MADEATQDKPQPAKAEDTEPKAAEPKARAKDEETADPNAVPSVNLREARLAESKLVAEGQPLAGGIVINGPAEDPYKGIDPAFLY